MRFAKLSLLLVALSGCGGSSQVSPIVEYNAAMESYDREAKALQEIQRAASATSDQKTKSALQDKAKQKEQVLEKIKSHARDASSRL